ncbi:unnamed protein product, partial [Schistosoma intercalatum]
IKNSPFTTDDEFKNVEAECSLPFTVVTDINVMISDLQRKLMDAGERSSTDASGPPDSTGQMLSSRLCQLHSIQEARIALKYLFR